MLIIKNDDIIYELISNSNYEVSRSGYIKYKEIEKIIRTNRDGYSIIRIHYKGKRKELMVHRIVWAKFGNEPLKDTDNWTINHKDGNKSNNHIDNLEQVSQSVNNKDAYDKGLRLPTKGNVVRSQAWADNIRYEHEVLGYSYKEIVEMHARQGDYFGKGYVSQIIKNKIWKKEN